MTDDPQRLKFWSISLGVFCLIVFAITAGLTLAYYVKVYLPEKKELEERREFLLKVKMLKPDEIPIFREAE